MARGCAWAVSGLLLGVPLLAQGASAEPPLSVSGSVHDLQVGAPGTLHLTVTNDGAADAVVTALSARVTSASAGCTVSALIVTPWSGRLVVPTSGTAERSLPVVVADVGGCAGATWELAYSAS